MAAKKKTKTTKRSTKAKKPVKKKANKVVDAHAGKRYFRIELAGRGSEIIIGRASEEFVQYWMNEERSDNLYDHIRAMDEKASFGDDMLEEAENDEITLDLPENYDTNSPEVYEGAGDREYYSWDDIEHETLLSFDYSGYTVNEIKVDPKTEYYKGSLEWNSKESQKRNFNWSADMFTTLDGTEQEYSFDKTVCSREFFVHDNKKGLVDPQPVMVIYELQKGTFGHIIVQTNGEDFDPNKLVVSVLETGVGNHIEMYYYDKNPLSVDTNWLDTWGKGAGAYVGYAPLYDIEFDFQKYLEQGWENLDSED